MSGIRVEGLGKRFGTRVAVEGLSFEVAPGEVFGLLGPNGAGKTTTVRMLTGLLTPTWGDATVAGISSRHGGEDLRRKVGLLTEQPGLYDRLTGKENLLFFIKLNELDEDAAWARALGYLERFGLKGREDEPCGSWSKGMRQKLAIIRTLVHDPEVVIFDEPTSGLDPDSARTVRDCIAELASEKRTIVLCSHNLAEVERLCQRVAVVKGRLLALSAVRDLRRAGHALQIKVAGDAARFLPALAALPFSPKALVEGGLLRVLLSDEEQQPEVLRALIDAGARVYHATRIERPLEEVYLELVRA
ncbi:MAG: ABC transporter ATP-binding protein [Myxococcaceae bacterium]|nr:ABC transporter ATP-binding protein [Myxococcaceae bacterium]